MLAQIKQTLSATKKEEILLREFGPGLHIGLPQTAGQTNKQWTNKQWTNNVPWRAPGNLLLCELEPRPRIGFKPQTGTLQLIASFPLCISHQFHCCLLFIPLLHYYTPCYTATGTLEPTVPQFCHRTTPGKQVGGLKVHPTVQLHHRPRHTFHRGMRRWPLELQRPTTIGRRHLGFETLAFVQRGASRVTQIASLISFLITTQLLSSSLPNISCQVGAIL